MALYDTRVAQFDRTQANGLYEYRYRAVQEFRKTFSYALFGTLDTAIAIAAGLGTKAAVEAAKKFLGSVDFASRNNLLLLGNAWARAGATAQQATLDAYDALLIRGGHGTYTIPRGNRLAGHLRPALASPGFYVASSEGIRWGNLAILNDQARHWARLNFGTEGSRGQSPTSVALGQSRYQSFAGVQPGIEGISSFADEVLQSGIGHFGRRGGFSMPPGQWVTDGGQLVGPHEVNPSVDQFIPGGFKGPHTASDYKPLFMQDRPTAGIAPRRFLDAGIRTLVLAFGDQLVGVIRQWERLPSSPVNEALRQGYLTVDANGVWSQA